jgi:hypothetical protein
MVPLPIRTRAPSGAKPKWGDGVDVGDGDGDGVTVRTVGVEVGLHEIRRKRNENAQ